MPSGHEAKRQRRLAILTVIGVALVAGCVRLFLIEAYLPDSHNYDENINVRQAEGVVDDGAVQPPAFNYPALLSDVEVAVLWGHDLVGDVPDGSALEVQTRATAHYDNPGVLRSLRWATGLLPGVITQLCAGAIAWLITRRWWVATLAAALAGLSALDLLYGIYVSPDAWSGAAAALAVLTAVHLAIRPSPLRYVLAGLAVGLAAGSKYNAVLSALPLLVAHLSTQRRPFANWRLVLRAAIAALAMFVVTTPAALYSPIEVAVGVSAIVRDYRVGHFDAAGDSPLFQLKWLWYSFGIALLAAPLVLLAGSRTRRLGFICLSFGVAYPAMLAVSDVRFARNLLPATGVIAATAAIGVATLVDRIDQQWSRRLLTRMGTAVAIVVVLAVPTTHAVATVSASRDDPWSDTQSWLEDNLEPGAKVAVESWAPFLDNERLTVLPVEPQLGKHPLTWYETYGVDVLVTTSKRYWAFLAFPEHDPSATEFYRAILRPECRLFEASGGLDPVGSRPQPEPITIVVVSVAECT